MKKEGLSLFLKAVSFAAHKHRDQRRKGERQLPYINHPIEVAELMMEVGGVENPALLAAGVLHDTIEDTDTTAEELSALFGEQVCAWVLEVSDDKGLPKLERKALQIEHSGKKSPEARLITLADKTCNIRDLCNHRLPDWSFQRIYDYFVWAKKVVDQIKGSNEALEAEFYMWNRKGLESFGKKI